MPSRPKKTDSKQIRSLVDSTAPRAASPKAWPPGRPPGGKLPDPTKRRNGNDYETFENDKHERA